MSALIRLATPADTGPNAARVYYSVGRSLSATQFVLQNNYVDGRLLGLTPANAGTVAGLGVSPARYDGPGLTTFVIGAGTGIGNDGRLVRLTAPISVSWTTLLQTVFPSSTIPDGAYLLILRTLEIDGVEGPPPNSPAGAGSDPLLDLREDSFVEVWLSARIAALPAALTRDGVALGLNTLVGGLSQEALAIAVGAGVPLALLLVQNGQLIMLSQAAGRVAAEANPLNALLLAQTREAFAMALADLGTGATADAWRAMAARFRFLPGAGELPLSLLKTPATAAASCPFLPAGIAVYLQAIHASRAPHMLGQALGHPRIDLASGDAEAVTLSLAVPDASWTPDLLDMPRADPVLPADLHLAYARARVAQVAWREDWIALYGGLMAVPAAFSQEIAFLIGADAAAQNLLFLWNSGAIQTQDLLTAAAASSSPATLLPLVTGWLNKLKAVAAPPAPIPPAPPAAPNAADAAHQLANLGYRVVDIEPALADPSVAGAAPVSSDSVLTPLIPYLPANSTFAAWSAAISSATANHALLQPLFDSGVLDITASAATRATAIAALLALPAATDPANDDTQPGALMQLATLHLFYAVLARVARAQEYLMDGHGRLIALQRQHLDMMSTYVSAIAGGVPSDGSGLSVTRIIPFINLVPPAPTATPAPAAAPAASAGSATFSARSFVFDRKTVTTPSQQLALNKVQTTLVTSKPDTSVVAKTPVDSTILSSPTISHVGSLFGNQTDIAKAAAAETSSLSQTPPFSYAPVQYGIASHITSGATLFQSAQTGLSGLRTLMGQNRINLTSTTPIPTASSTDEASYYDGVIQVTRVLLSDITLVENNAIRIEAGYVALRDRLQSLEALGSQLTAAMATARDKLRSAQVAAAQAAGDYAAAQTLVKEEAARVTAAILARNQAIAAATGLFYVRQLQTAIALDRPAWLSLTADTPADVAPACPADHPGPPAALTPFLDLLLEVPLSSLSALHGGWIDLPDNAGLRRLSGLRAARLVNWIPSTEFGSGSAAPDLANLATTTRSVFDPVLRNSFNLGASLAVNQQAAFAVFSPPDLLTLPANNLRTRVEALRARLESATGCLFQTLIGLPPSARFAWAALARAGTLPALRFSQWPLPEGLGDAGTAALRQLAALVHWMASQLTNDASAAAQTALNNLICATVIASAYGDPDEAISGTVVSSGGVPRPGHPVRITLNRPPPIGTLLNLLDANQNIVGTLRVQDHDGTGTTAAVVTSFATTEARPDWTVASQGGRSPWLSS